MYWYLILLFHTEQNESTVAMDNTACDIITDMHNLYNIGFECIVA
jgi:hypothetical protein